MGSIPRGRGRMVLRAGALVPSPYGPLSGALGGRGARWLVEPREAGWTWRVVGAGNQTLFAGPRPYSRRNDCVRGMEEALGQIA